MNNKVTSFDRSVCKLIGAEILEAIKPVAEKHGLEVTKEVEDTTLTSGVPSLN